MNNAGRYRERPLKSRFVPKQICLGRDERIGVATPGLAANSESATTIGIPLANCPLRAFHGDKKAEMQSAARVWTVSAGVLE